MGIHVDTYKCKNCGALKDVVHTGRPTIRDFADAGFVKNSVWLGDDSELLCFDCEAEEMEAEYEPS